METLVSAVLGDLISRSISFAVDRCCHRRRKGGIEDAPLRLRRVLLRVQAVVEEADRRRVTNQAMLRQLQLMRDGVYRGHYLLSAFKSQRASQGKTTQQDREVSHPSSSFALSRFNPAKRLCTLSARTTTTTTAANMASDDTRREWDAEAELQEVLTGLERMAIDMKELVVFLSCYPPARREPYSGHLWLENRMFGREAEQERIMSFLLETEPVGTQDCLGVLPVIGRARVGKSTLVEHVCFDERVRRHFSQIVFLGDGDIKDGKPSSSPHHLGDNAGIIKHRDLDSSAGKSLVVIELDGDDVDESTLGGILSALRGERTAPVSKILVTSRSEKIASFGTTRALELKPLPREAYWYFFKTIAFGSTDAEDHPELASVCIEMADLLNGSFISAHVFGTLLRSNLCAKFWRKVLTGFKHHTNMHLLLFGEHPCDLVAKGRPVYFWRLVPKADDEVLVVHSCYRACSDLPKITVNDVQIGRARPRGKFELLAWRSCIPPYYSYMLSCEVRTSSSSSLRRAARNKQIRQQHQQPRLNLM